MLTRRINDLTEHLRTHRRTYSRRGLLKLVGRRRRFLGYMQKHDLGGLSRPDQGAGPERYRNRESGSLDEPRDGEADPNFHSPPSRVEDME